MHNVLLKCFGLVMGGLLFVLGFMPSPASAQYYDDPGLGQKPVVAYPQDYKPLGIRAGAFMLHPGGQLAFEFTDNVFFTERDTKSDVVYHIRPFVTAQSTWSRHSVNVSLAADIARFGKYGRQDYEDYFLDVNGRLDVKTRSFATYSANYLQLHEDRSTRDSVQGFQPTVYHVYGGSIGYDHTVNRLNLRGVYTHQWLDYDNSVAADGDVIDNQDRDRDYGTVLLRAGYQFKTDMQAFVSYEPYKLQYKDEVDSGGYDRSGKGYAIHGGLNFNLTGKFNGDLYVSYNHRDYDDPQLPDISGWAAGAGLQWNPSHLTAVYGRIDSSIDETTSEYSSGFFRTQYSLRVDHELTRFIQVSGFVSYIDNDYTQIPGAPADAREYDRVWRNGVGFSWFINRYLYINASYAWEQLNTNVPDDGYTVNRVWLVLGVER